MASFIILLHHPVNYRDYIVSVTVDRYQHIWKDTDKENRSNRREQCRSDTVPATGPTWIGLKLKERLRSDKLPIDSPSQIDDGIGLHIKTFIPVE